VCDSETDRPACVYISHVSSNPSSWYRGYCSCHMLSFIMICVC